MPLYSWLLTFREDLNREIREGYVRAAIDYCGDRYIWHGEDNQDNRKTIIRVKFIKPEDYAGIRAKLKAEHEGLDGIEGIVYSIATTSEDRERSRARHGEFERLLAGEPNDKTRALIDQKVGEFLFMEELFKEQPQN